MMNAFAKWSKALFARYAKTCLYPALATKARTHEFDTLSSANETRSALAQRSRCRWLRKRRRGGRAAARPNRSVQNLRELIIPRRVEHNHAIIVATCCASAACGASGRQDPSTTGGWDRRTSGSAPQSHGAAACCPVR
jgi:hypothetical protein